MAEGTASELARTLGALACPERLKIVAFLLGQEGPCCSKLAQSLGLSNSALSYHLRILEGAGLVERWRNGRRHCLRLTPRAHQVLSSQVLRALQKEGRIWKARPMK